MWYLLDSENDGPVPLRTDSDWRSITANGVYVLTCVDPMEYYRGHAFMEDLDATATSGEISTILCSLRGNDILPTYALQTDTAMAAHSTDMLQPPPPTTVHRPSRSHISAVRNKDRRAGPSHINVLVWNICGYTTSLSQLHTLITSVVPDVLVYTGVLPVNIHAQYHPQRCS